jgi:NitT/TauT family transport system substrate-binding protein
MRVPPCIAHAVRRIGVLAALWLGSAPGPAAAGELRLAVSSGPVSLPIYVAHAQQYFANEGVAVHLRPCSSGRHCVQMLGQGQADLATAAELLVTLESFKGSDVALIATLSTSTRHIKLVARQAAGIQAPQDLRGKRVATVRGTSAQYFLDSWLVFQDIDPKDVHVLFLPPDQLTAALQRGEVDAVAIWEPMAATAVAAIGADARVLQSPRVYTQHFSLIAPRLVIATREADVVRLLRALEQAQRFIAERPAQARRILKDQLQGEAGVDKLEEHDFSLTLQQSLVATMEGQARWAERQGQLSVPGQRPANLLQYIEPALLRRTVPGAVSLVR